MTLVYEQDLDHLEISEDSETLGRCSLSSKPVLKRRGSSRHELVVTKDKGLWNLDLRLLFRQDYRSWSRG